MLGSPTTLITRLLPPSYVMFPRGMHTSKYTSLLIGGALVRDTTPVVSISTYFCVIAVPFHVVIPTR